MRKGNSKIGIIISHEYFSKIKSKGFIISTIVAPLAIVAILAVVVWISIISHDDVSKKIAILDRTGRIGAQIADRDTSKYYTTDLTENSLRKNVLEDKIDGYLVIPQDFLTTGQAEVFTKGGGGLAFMNALDDNLNDIARNERLKDLGADEAVIKLVEQGISISSRKVTEQGTEADYSQGLAFLGYALAFIIYMFMFIYGGFVSQGVIEEKSNRIVEVLASSAKPYDIMMGKIVGIGLVGLTQIAFWMIIILTLIFGLAPLAVNMMEPDTMKQAIESAQQSGQMAQAQGGGKAEEMQGAIDAVKTAFDPMLIVAFIFYFLGGYFIYSTIFAALGSAVDQQTDAAQLQTPVSMLIIIPMLFIQLVMSNPDSTASVVLSLIPFFAPMLMILRIAATQVPLWQIGLSVALMVGTFFGMVWIASRIYKIGILMYGVKPTWKELFKWLKIANQK